MVQKIILIISLLHCLSLEASTMVYGETSRVESFDPYTIHEMTGYRLADLIFDGLVSLDVSGKYKSELADKWLVLPGNTKVRLDIKKDVFWHNNERVTAHDVVKTIEVIKHPKSEIPSGDRFDLIKSARTLSDNTLEIEFTQALSDPMKLLTFKIMPKSSFQDKPFLDKNHLFTKNPIGTGPYVFKSSSKQGEVVLEVNRKYYKGPPKIEKVILKSYNDQHIMTQSLMYNALDLVTWVSPHDISEIFSDKNLSVTPYDSLEFSFIGINQDKKYFQNEEVRRALNHAIHKEEMLSSFFQNRGKIISGPFSPSSWAYNISVPNLQWDQEYSRKIFQFHGLDKRSLKLVVPISGKSDLTKRIVLACQNYFAQVGLKVDLVFLDWIQWKEKVLYQRDYDLAIATWNFDDANNIKSLFHSESNVRGGYNFVGLSDQQVDSLLTEASLTSDYDKRRAIYHKLHAVLSEKSPYIWLWTLQNHAAYRKEMSGVKIESFSFFKNIMAWNKKNSSHI